MWGMLTLTPLLTLLLNPVPTASGEEPPALPSKDDPTRGIPAVLEAEPSEFVTWRTPASNKLAARLTRNEKAAYDEAFRAIEGKDPDKAREAAAALASVDTVDGWRHLRRRCAAWESTQKRQFVLPQEEGCGIGVYAAALETVARRTGRPQEVLLLDVARGLEAGEEEDLYAFARLTPSLWTKLVPLVAEARAEGATNKGLRAFIDRVDSDVVSSEPDGGGYRKEASKLQAYHEAKDRKALLAYARSPRPMYMLRLLAAYHLARLGDGSALDLFEDPAFLDSGDAHVAEVSLEELVTETQGPLRERVKAILELYTDARHPAEGLELDATKPSKKR